MAKGVPISYFPVALYFILNTRLSALFFIIIWKDLLELLLVLVIFPLQQKNKQKKRKKRYNLTTESLLSNNISDRFKFIKTPIRRKNLWPPWLKWNNDYLLKQ